LCSRNRLLSALLLGGAPPYQPTPHRAPAFEYNLEALYLTWLSSLVPVRGPAYVSFRKAQVLAKACQRYTHTSKISISPAESDEARNVGRGHDAQTRVRPLAALHGFDAFTKHLAECAVHPPRHTRHRPCR
uniref:Reverse transcriptase domain-containing protein n=1 Tax=Macrostomum lignano TaxID=282301 RepID=A0A1I8F1T3_9PLAT